MVGRDLGGHAVVGGADEVGLAFAQHDRERGERPGTGQPQGASPGRVPDVRCGAEQEGVDPVLGHPGQDPVPALGPQPSRVEPTAVRKGEHAGVGHVQPS